MNKKVLYKSLYALIYCCGFPALAITSLVLSCNWNSYGMYGVGAFAPFLFVICLWAVVEAVKWTIVLVNKKKGKETNPNTIAYTGCILAVALVFGVFLIFEGILPAALHDATSNTIRYEDVLDDAQGQHDLLVKKVQAFKDKNKDLKNAKVSDKVFQDKFHAIYDSMDKAYDDFDDLGIDLALRYSDDLLGAVKEGKIPVNVLASLVVKTSVPKNILEAQLALVNKNIKTLTAEKTSDEEALANAKTALENNKDEAQVKALEKAVADAKKAVEENAVALEEASAKAKVLTNKVENFDPNDHNNQATLEEILAFNQTEITNVLKVLVSNISNVKDPDVLNEAISKIIYIKEYDGIKWNILNILGTNPLDENMDVNGRIVRFSYNEDGSPVLNEDGTVKVEDLGGCLGYQDMAWINGLSDMFFIPLMAFRNMLFAFTLAIGLISLMMGAMKKGYAEKFDEKLVYFKKK